MTERPDTVSAEHWDARYRDHGGSMWSGRPNGRLVAEVVDLPPGRALDVGCGEGADAIWLAQHGWSVTAIDISSVAVDRARQVAADHGVIVEWISGDAFALDLPARGRTSWSRSSTRRCRGRPVTTPCGGCSTRSARAACSSRCSTTSTTTIAST